MDKNVKTAKEALDKIIGKSRSLFYKPIQIAEILYHYRIGNGGVDLDNLESYRNSSKLWRDQISKDLVGRVCNSSARFQDNLFDDNATPPKVIKALALENKKNNGAVEAYIYRQFTSKHDQLSAALDICNNSTKESFILKDFLNSFWNEPGLKRSIDKVYEIIVYALFSTLIEVMEMEVEVSVKSSKIGILTEFRDFAKKVMCLDINIHEHKERARVYRVGVTNAADRGLDMYSNWGPAIQIKHLSLDVELAENIVSSISSDRIVIVCKDAEKSVILSLLAQIGWKSRIQSIVTENNLIDWYEKALRGKYSNIFGDKLLDKIRKEMVKEFPSIDSSPKILKDRHYENIHNSEW